MSIKVFFVTCKEVTIYAFKFLGFFWGKIVSHFDIQPIFKGQVTKLLLANDTLCLGLFNFYNHLGYDPRMHVTSVNGCCICSI